MVNNNYVGGTSFEYQVRDYYKSKGYFVSRSAGSKGPLDLIAWSESEIVFIQCKKERKKKSYTKDIIELLSVPNLPFACRKEFWVKRKGMIEVTEWPGEVTRNISIKKFKEIINGN